MIFLWNGTIVPFLAVYVNRPKRGGKRFFMQFERLRKAEISQAAELAARSFLDYAYFSIFVPNAKRRFRFLNTMLSVEFSINDDRAELWVAKEDGEIIAVAMLCSPDYHKPTDSQYMKAGFWKVFLAGGIKAVSDWNAMDAEAGKPCHSRKDAWYLSLLTVDPQEKDRASAAKCCRNVSFRESDSRVEKS